MKKIVIPTIFAATVLLAGMFAFMPVEKASAVHTTVQGTQWTQVDNELSNDLAADPIACTSTTAFIVYISAQSVTDDTTVAVTDGTTTVTYRFDVGAAASDDKMIIVPALAGTTITATGSAGTVDGIVGAVTQSGATQTCG